MVTGIIVIKSKIQISGRGRVVGGEWEGIGEESGAVGKWESGEWGNGE